MITRSMRGARISLMVAALMINGCATSPPLRAPANGPEPPQPSPAHVQEKLATFLRCVIHNEPLLDDRLSEARTIALALTDRCGAEYQAVTSVGLVTQNPSLRAMWLQDRPSTDRKSQESLDTVLSMRNGMIANPSGGFPLLVRP